ncbi:MFS transporter [Modestobacter sp. NPDC049651]|uniref:MFS transporter n=1 Tax=unclassified Modestobacter TaxID=2643866 RepID=UPI0033D4172C
MVKRALQSTSSHPLVVSGLMVIAVTYGLTRYGYGVFLPQFRADLGVTSSVAGAIAAGSYLAYCAAALAGARLVAAGRARGSLWLAGLSAAAGAVLVGVAWSVPALAVGALVAGSGAGAASPALVAAVADTVAPDVEARAQAVVNSGTGAGVVAGGLLVLAWVDGWRSLWLGFAVAAVLTTWWADRSATWSAARDRPRSTGPRAGRARAVTAAGLAGAGGTAVWTFGRDLTTGSGLSDQVTGALWCLLGAAALLGGLSGRLVERAGLRGAWVATAAATAAGTGLLAWRPGSVVVAAVALAVFGCGFVALSGVLISWGTALAPEAAAQTTAALFVALTVGQAAGALLLGALADAAGSVPAFVVAAGLVLAAAPAAPRRVPTGPPPVAAGPR